MRPPAILVGGQASTLSAARGLAQADVEVVVVADARTSPVRRSRSCRRFVHVPSGTDVQDRWLERLLDLEPGVVLPCTDEALHLIACHRADLVARGHLVYDCDDELALAMLDKERTYALAQNAGVPVPRTVRVVDVTALERAVQEIGFPCAVKPVSPVHFRRIYGLRRKLFVTDSFPELEARFAETRASGLEVLLTEIIPGADDAVWAYTTYVGKDGRPLFDLSRRKLRQWPPHFGIGSYHITQRDEQVVAEGRRFVERVRLRGFVAVELKRDARDGRLVLIECNQRFVNASELLLAAGVNVAFVAYAQSAGRIAPLQPPFREGVRLLFLAEDARAFLELRRTRELSARAWLRSLLHRQRFPVFSVDDPLPSIFTNAALASQVVGRRLKRVAARVRGREDA
jgi:D-aspartate ligase